MLGTVVNNRQLIELQSAGRIRIHPFDQKILRTIHYPLTAARFLECVGREGKEPKFDLRCDFGAGPRQAEFEAKEYLVAEIEQSIALEDGIVGHFVPSSTLVDYGFSLTCGRIEAPYGHKGETIRFGLSNQLNRKNVILKDEVLAYVYFIDLRALANVKVYLSPDQLDSFKRWQKRHAYAEDSGIHPLE